MVEIKCFDKIIKPRMVNLQRELDKSGLSEFDNIKTMQWGQLINYPFISNRYVFLIKKTIHYNQF